ncbi:MAG: MBOAT family O-acyltransferase [Pseudomonadota bacterium]
MQFTTLQFALFFLCVLPLNWMLRERPGPYKAFLGAANIFFYGFLDVRFLPLLLVVAYSNWHCALLTVSFSKKSTKKAILSANLVVNLGLLAFFKYFEFFFAQLETALLFVGWTLALPPWEITFPIGISFFTFQGLSYAIDVYRDPRKVVRGFGDVFLFVSFFPTIMSGPILRADRFIPFLETPRRDPEDFQAGFGLILSGLFKKIVLAGYLSEHIVRQVFQVPEACSSLTVLLGVYAYSIQIFCDFSGYSDLAMGVALLLGYKIPENFRSPYTALNLQDFWRRWHISLSTWLRDYLYISLGGNRLGPGRKYLNLMITMVLGGLWHGAHTRFLLWGALHGAGLAVTHFVEDLRGRGEPSHRNRYRRRIQDQVGRAPGWLGNILSWLLLFHFVTLLWVFFRADDAARAWDVIRSIPAWRSGAGFEPWVVPAILAGLAVQFTGGWTMKSFLGLQQRLPVFLQAAVIALACVVILRLGPEGVPPFIYFQF